MYTVQVCIFSQLPLWRLLDIVLLEAIVQVFDTWGPTSDKSSLEACTLSDTVALSMREGKIFFTISRTKMCQVALPTSKAEIPSSLLINKDTGISILNCLRKNVQ